MQEDANQTPDSWQQPTPTQGGVPYTAASPLGSEYQGDDPEERNNHTDPQDTHVPHASEEDEALLRWESAEYVDHNRSAGWYAILTVVAIALMALAVFYMKSFTFALLVPVMVAALVVYTRRPPATLKYTLSRKGLYVNQHLYTYDTYRAFSIIRHNGHNMANLIPRKRFQLAQMVYFPDEVGEPLVDMLAARMPMQEAKPDFFDRIISRLRM